MRLTSKILLVFSFLISGYAINAQDSIANNEIDTTKSVVIQKEKNPKIAGWLSFALPGAGQAYNGGWSIAKIPVIYGGFVGLYYYWNYSKVRQDFYHDILKWQDAKVSATDLAANIDNHKSKSEVTTASGTQLATLSQATVQNSYELYRSDVQRAYMFGTLWYGLNILDAVVDAHMKNFDINDDLTMKISPSLSSSLTTLTPSLKLSLSF